MQREHTTRKFVPRESSGGGLAFAALILGNISLSFGPWLVRLADVGPVAAGFWRLMIALPLLLLLTRLVRAPIPALPRGLWLMLAAGGLFFAADLGSWHAGILHTRLANATLFGNVASFIFAIYGFVIARERPHPAQVMALALAILGVTLMMGRSYALSSHYLVGDILCIAAGLFYFGYLVAIDRMRGRLHPLSTLSLATMFGVMPMLIFAWRLGEPILPGNWTPLILLAIGSQVIGQGLLVYAIGHLAPVIIGLGLLTQPAIAATIGWAAYGERLGPLDMLGMVMIGAAMILVRQPARNTAAEITPPPT